MRREVQSFSEQGDGLCIASGETVDPADVADDFVFSRKKGGMGFGEVKSGGVGLKGGFESAFVEEETGAVH